MGFTLRIEGTTAAIRELEQLDERFHGPLRPLLEAITQVMTSTFQDRFHEGPPAGVTWPPLHPATLAIRRRYGHSGKPVLVRGGELRDSIRPLAQGPDYTEVGTTHQNAALVQEGGETDRGGWRRTVLARPYVVLSDEDLDDLEDMAVRWSTGGDPASAGGAALA